MRDSTDVQAEYSAIRALLRDGTLAHATQLTPEMFSDADRRRVVAAILELSAKNLKIDEITVLDRVPREHRPECTAVLMDANNGAGMPRNFAAYEAIVVKAAEREQIISQAQYLAENPEKLDAVLARLTAAGGVSRWEHDQNQALDRAYALLDRMQAGTAGLPTGFPDLDELLGGLMPGRLTVIGGRPAMGKTAIAMSMALNCGAPLGFISSEMAVDQIVLRALSSLSQIPLSLATKGMAQHQYDQWNAAASDFRERPFYLNDRPGITIEEIGKQARKWVYNNGCRLLLIDYCQRLGGDPKLDRTEKIRHSIEGAKEIARQLDIHVIMLSQVNRGIEGRPDKRPGMADLDGAGTIEAEADHVIALYRPWVYDKSQPKGEVELLVAKNRHGASPETVFAHFDGATTTFTPASERNRAPF